ncbi:MAG: hypothetical protein JWQ87_3939, partial [Candidatus Sulfotelmatobacter sp.]|nr:hypothetical protein [Candidatus Sulfotelmatobacter sp.]
TLTKRRFLFRTLKHGRQGKRLLLTSGGPNQTIEVGHAGRSNSTAELSYAASLQVIVLG